MGNLAVLPTSTFSQATQQGQLDLSGNCIVYVSMGRPEQDTLATNCIGQ